MGTLERVVGLEDEGLDKSGYRRYYCFDNHWPVNWRSCLDYGLATLSETLTRRRH